MKDLWNQTLELLRRHIVLWVPCSAAAVLMFALGQLNAVWIHWLMKVLSTQHSVFGGESQSTNMDQVIEQTTTILIPFALLKQFAEVSFFVVALVITKCLAQTLISQQAPALPEVILELKLKFREALFFALKYMAVVGVTGGAFVLFSSSPLGSDRIHQLALSKVFLYAFGLAVEGCLGWLLLPSAIRLLRPSGSPKISSRGRQVGTLFAVAASAVALGLQFGIGKAEVTLRVANGWEGDAVALANTLLMNVPNTFLFVALALLAIRGPEEATSLIAQPEAA